MKREELFELAKDAVNDAELESRDIPAIDLYVDQIINLVSGKLSEGSERFLDRQLTKTMINNYSKEGLINEIKGKKYNKEQIMQILTIYTLKNTLTIGEIKRVLSGAYENESFDVSALTDMYDRHLSIKKDDRRYALDTLEGILDRNSLDPANDVDYINTICALASFSFQLKSIAQAMIDARFPEPVEDAEDDKEKEKKEKKEKKEEKKEIKEKEKEEKKENKKKKKEGELPPDSNEDKAL